MSLTSKLLTTIGAVFILTIAGAIGVAAQTQTVSDNSSTSTGTSTAGADPKKAEVKKPVTVPAERTAPEKTAEVIRDSSNSSSTAGAPVDSPVLPSPAPAADDKWQFVGSPYFWMAGLHGPVGGSNRSVQVDERFSDIFHSLKFAFMGVFEAHKGKWGLQTDFEYVSLEDEKATPGPLFSNANAKIKTVVFTPEVGYRFYNDPEKGSFVELLGGTRIWHISSDLSFGARVLPAVEIKTNRSWVDGVVGLRGKAALSEKFFLMGRFDLGGGGSKFTYQLFGGLGYNVNKKVALVFGYRDLDVNYDKNNFRYDTSQRGPIMGVGFKF